MDDNILIEDYLTYLKKNRHFKDSTVNIHRKILGALKTFCEEQEATFANASPEDMMAWINYRLETVKAITIRNDLCAFKQFYSFLRCFKNVCNSSLDAVPEMICEPSPEQHYLSVDQCREFLGAFDQNELTELRNYTIFALLWSTGLRSAELCSLEWRDIRFQHEYLLVRDGKGRKQRQVYLNDRIAKELKLYKMTVNPRVETEPVFYNLRSNNPEAERKQLTVSGLNTICDAHEKKLKWDHSVSPMTFRHTFATHMFERGVRVQHIKEMMGHDVDTETTTYIHVSLDAAKNLLRAHIANPSQDIWRIFK